MALWALAFPGLLQTCALGQAGSNLIATTQAKDASKPNAAPAATAQPNLPACPKAGLIAPQLSPLKSGHHTVTLSWNANPPSTKPESQAVGYCLYRSRKQNAAKKNPLCADCEQVNSAAIAGTGCVDDLVQDDTIYYYVVTAANSKGAISASSNEAKAPVRDAQSAKPAAPSSYPLCRVK